MEIFGIQTHSHEIQTFYEKIASYVTLSVFENQDALILSLDSCEIVLVDAFTNESKAKKLIQKIKKANADVTVWAIVNHTSKKFIKNIKTAKNSSVDEVIELEISDNDLIELLNEKKSLVNKDDTRTVALKILEDHSEVEMSSKAKEISHKLDSLFSSVYFIDYSRLNVESKLRDKKKEGDIVTDSNEDELEFGGLELGDDDLELNIGEDDDIPVDDEEKTRVGLDLDMEEEVEFSLEGNSVEESDEDSHIGNLDIEFTDDDEAQVKEAKTVTELTFNLAGEDDIKSDEEPTSLNIDLGETGEDIISLDEESEADGVEFNLSKDEDELTRPIENLQAELKEKTKEEESLELSNTESDNIEIGIDLSAGDSTGDEEISLAAEGSEADESEIEGEFDLFDDDDEGFSPLDDLKTKILEIDAILAQDNEENSKDENIGTMTETKLDESGARDEFSFEVDEAEAQSEDEPFEEWKSEETTANTTGNDREIEQHHFNHEESYSESSSSEVSGHEFKLYKQGHEDELIRLSETIKSLRLDRDQLLEKVENLENSLDSQRNNHLSIQAALDEKKIEIEIIKKRFQKKVEDLSIKLELVENKKDILEEENKVYSSELLSIQKEKKMNVSRVRMRERELEEKLELLKKDTDVQIRNRDLKILDLKRKIDSLEFDIEAAYTKEKQSSVKQHVIEEKMNKVIRTLRTVIGQVEEESLLEERKKLIKKNMDV